MAAWPCARRERSKVRAQAFLEALPGPRYDDLRRTPVPLVVVVGSKGKGTTAAYASAALAAAGLRVGTLTSPGFRSHRERIRVDEQSITPTELARLAMVIAQTLERCGNDLPNDGYLSPTGLFNAVDKFGVVMERTSHVVIQPGQDPVAMEVISTVAKKRAQVLDVAEVLNLLDAPVDQWWAQYSLTGSPEERSPRRHRLVEQLAQLPSLAIGHHDRRFDRPVEG